jgi:hypothetical protein
MSNWVDRIVAPRPEEEQIFQARTLVADAVCPTCGSSDVRRYPIANHLGPRMAVKCQACLHILSVERPSIEDAWPPFRAVAYDWEPSLSERAGRVAFDADRAAAAPEKSR